MSDGRHALAVPEAAGLFDDVEVETVLVRDEQTADEVVAHLRTTSFWFMVAEDRRQAFDDDYRRLIERHGGLYRFSRADVLMTARRLGRALPPDVPAARRGQVADTAGCG